MSLTVLERRLPMGGRREVGLGGKGGFTRSALVGSAMVSTELYRRKGSCGEILREVSGSGECPRITCREAERGGEQEDCNGYLTIGTLVCIMQEESLSLIELG